MQSPSNCCPFLKFLFFDGRYGQPSQDFSLHDFMTGKVDQLKVLVRKWKVTVDLYTDGLLSPLFYVITHTLTFSKFHSRYRHWLKKVFEFLLCYVSGNSINHIIRNTKVVVIGKDIKPLSWGKTRRPLVRRGYQVLETHLVSISYTEFKPISIVFSKGTMSLNNFLPFHWEIGNCLMTSFH